MWKFQGLLRYCRAVIWLVKLLHFYLSGFDSTLYKRVEVPVPKDKGVRKQIFLCDLEKIYTPMKWNFNYLSIVQDSS